MARHVVTGAAVVLATEDGSERYLYRGAPVGDGFTKDSIKLAKSLGLIESVKDAPELEPAKTPEPYKGVSVADLKVEIEKRNEGREDDTKIVAAEPGNRAEIVAALVADDTK
jgi:hypothetical protein